MRTVVKSHGLLADFGPNMRVGDEKDPDEADTVGAKRSEKSI
jgi:hypothetical protein